MKEEKWRKIGDNQKNVWRGFEGCGVRERAREREIVIIT